MKGTCSSAVAADSGRVWMEGEAGGPSLLRQGPVQPSALLLLRRRFLRRSISAPTRRASFEVLMGDASGVQPVRGCRKPWRAGASYRSGVSLSIPPTPQSPMQALSFTVCTRPPTAENHGPPRIGDWDYSPYRGVSGAPAW